MKKNIKYTIYAVIIGIIIGKYIFYQYTKEEKMVINNTDNIIYLMQYGVYKDEKNMIESTKKLINYFYYKDEKGYHVLIGITKNKNLKQKIVDSYGLTANIYMKGVKNNNQEFIQSLSQYDELIEHTKDKKIIINAQKQILSKYEELIVNNEI